MQQFVKIASAFFNQKLPVISPLMNFRNLNDSGNEDVLRSFCQNYLGDRLEEFNYNQLVTVLSLLSYNIMDNGFLFKENKLYAKYNMSDSFTNIFIFPTKFPNDDIKKVYLTALYLAHGTFTYTDVDFIESYIDNIEDAENASELSSIACLIKSIDLEVMLYEFDSELLISKYPEYKKIIELTTWCINLHKQMTYKYNTDGDIDLFRSCIIVPDLLYNHHSDCVDYLLELNNECYIDDLLVELDKDLSMDIYPMALYYLWNEIEQKYIHAINAQKSNCSICK